MPSPSTFLTSKRKGRFIEQFRIVLGAYSVGFLSLYPFIHLLFGLRDASLWFKKSDSIFLEDLQGPQTTWFPLETKRNKRKLTRGHPSGLSHKNCSCIKNCNQQRVETLAVTTNWRQHWKDMQSQNWLPHKLCKWFQTRAPWHITGQ